MKRPKPGFFLVAAREWRWLTHDRAALILMFGVPLFAFVILTAVFSHPVIRGLGVAVVDGPLRGGIDTEADLDQANREWMTFTPSES